MHQPIANQPLEPSLWVVGAALEEARARVAQLAHAGVEAAAHTDLERVLEAAPAVVLIDPEGWEERCRRLLEGIVQRSAAPPAVLFLAADPMVQVSAGPAFGYVSSSATLRDLTLALRRAARAREAFLSYWPAAGGPIAAVDEVRIKAVLRELAGLDIRGDRQNTFVDALRTRMLARLTPRARDYAELLRRARGDYSELELFTQRLVIGETHFWRYAGQFRALQQQLVPHFANTRNVTDRCFRVWSAGTSTGEETYSLAFACRQALPASWQLEVHGTDIDRVALDRATRGGYSPRTLRNLPPELRSAHFEERGGLWQVRDGVREAVQFHHLNLAASEVDTWAQRHGPFHAIFCRNVLIYFSAAEVERTVARLEAALVPGGGLFLGASETLPAGGRRGMEVVRGSGSFFFRRGTLATGPEREQRPAPPAPPRGGEGQAKELYALGLSRLDDEDFPGARDVFAELLVLRPEDARGHCGMALLLANQGREPEAIQHLKQAAHCVPDLPETHYLQGLVAERLGNDEEALMHYAAALVREPEFFMAHINRAWVLDRLGRRDPGRAALRAALRLLQQRPPVARWLSGGLSGEALLDLVQEALAERGEQR